MPENFSMDKLLPHAAPMILLDEVLEKDNDSITCALSVRGDGLFDRNGAVPAWIGIEYMAQAVAAYSGVERQQQGEAVRLGFLLGTRRYHSNVSEIAIGQRLQVRAEKLIEGSNGMASFQCQVSGTGIELSAVLSVYEPRDAGAQEILNGATP